MREKNGVSVPGLWGLLLTDTSGATYINKPDTRVITDDNPREVRHGGGRGERGEGPSRGGEMDRVEVGEDRPAPPPPHPTPNTRVIQPGCAAISTNY